jgi:hypothetical protein
MGFNSGFKGLKYRYPTSRYGVVETANLICSELVTALFIRSSLTM